VKEYENRPDDRYVVKATPKQLVKTDESNLEDQNMVEELSESNETEEILSSKNDFANVSTDGNVTDDKTVPIASEAPNKTDRDIPSFRYDVFIDDKCKN